MVLKNKTRGQLNKDLLSQLVVCLFILHFFFSLLWEFVLKCTHTHTQRPILVRSIKEGSIMFSGSWDNLKEEMSNYTYMNRHIYYILYINFYGSKEKRVARSWVNSLGCKTKRLSPTLACSNMLFFFPPFSLRENLWSWFAIVKLICGLREKKKSHQNLIEMKEITQTCPPPDLTFHFHVVLEHMRSLSCTWKEKTCTNIWKRRRCKYRDPYGSWGCR